MGSSLIRYYIFKDTLSHISPQITYTIDTSNQVLFRYALFYSIGEFYKAFRPLQKDNYQLSKRIQSNLQEFLKECMEDAHYHSSNEEKFFCYYIFLSYIINQTIPDYLHALVQKKKRFSFVEKSRVLFVS